MTKEVLKKIEGTTHKETLDYKKKMAKHLEEIGYAKDAEKARASIAGYIQALRDCKIITESERKTLFVYYATM